MEILKFFIPFGIAIFIVWHAIRSQKIKPEGSDKSSSDGMTVVPDKPIVTEKSWIEKIREQYGKETLKFGWDDEKSLLFFDDSKIFFWKGTDYQYASIVSCKLEPFYKIITTNNNQSVSITKTNTGNMIGRAIVGTLVAGPVGCLAGALSAKKTTTTTMPDVHSKTVVDYYCLTIIMENGFNIARNFHDDSFALTAFEKVKSIIEENTSKQSERPITEVVSEKENKGNIVENLSAIMQMREKGLLTEEEFAKAKKQLLS